jgi:hypothetical protein
VKLLRQLRPYPPNITGKIFNNFHCFFKFPCLLKAKYGSYQKVLLSKKLQNCYLKGTNFNYDKLRGFCNILYEYRYSEPGRKHCFRLQRIVPIPSHNIFYDTIYDTSTLCRFSCNNICNVNLVGWVSVVDGGGGVIFCLLATASPTCRPQGPWPDSGY